MKVLKIGDLVTPIYNLSGFKSLLTVVDSELTEEKFPQMGISYTVRSVGDFHKSLTLKEFRGNNNLISGEYTLPSQYFINFFDGYDYFLRANINIRRPGWKEIVEDYIYSNPKREGFFKPPHPRLLKPYKDQFHNEIKKKLDSKILESLTVKYLNITKLSEKQLRLQVLQFFSLKDCIKMLEYSISNNLSFPSLDDGANRYNIYTSKTNE